MPDLALERGFLDRLSHGHLAQGRAIAQVRQGMIIHSCAADRHQRVGGQLGKVAPAHHGLARQRRKIDRIALAEIADRSRKVCRRQLPQPAREELVGIILLCDRLRCEAPLAPVDHQADAAFVREDLFQREPPCFADPIRECGRHIDRERHAMPRQGRIGAVDQVLVAAVESQADETSRLRQDHRAPADLVHGDELILPSLQRTDGPVEKSRRDFACLERLEAVLAAAEACAQSAGSRLPRRSRGSARRRPLK